MVTNHVSKAYLETPCSYWWPGNVGCCRLTSSAVLEQVANASYVWLPLLPRTDGQPGYALQSLDRWRPKDFRQQARLPVSVEPEGISAVEQAWMDITYAPSTQSQRTGTVSAIAT